MRYVTLQFVESQLTRSLFSKILGRIEHFLMSPDAEREDSVFELPAHVAEVGRYGLYVAHAQIR